LGARDKTEKVLRMHRQLRFFWTNPRHVGLLTHHGPLLLRQHEALLSPGGPSLSMGPSGNHATLRASGTQQIGTHHLVVLVLEHMAVPNVAPWLAVERDDNSSDLSGRAEDRV